MTVLRINLIWSFFFSYMYASNVFLSFCVLSKLSAGMWMRHMKEVKLHNFVTRLLLCEEEYILSVVRDHVPLGVEPDMLDVNLDILESSVGFICECVLSHRREDGGTSSGCVIALLRYIDKLHSKYRKLPLYDVDMIIRPVVKWLSIVGFDPDEFRSSLDHSYSCSVL